MLPSYVIAYIVAVAVAVALYVTLMLPDTLYHVLATNDVTALLLHVPGLSAVPHACTVFAEAVPVLVVLI